MTVRGYVYVFTNKGSPGLVKVGYSLKDPVVRAKELSTTGVVHPYVVEYDVLVLNPVEVEQAVHRALRSEGHHEAKEFFRVAVSDVIAKINQAIGNQGKTVLLENDVKDRKALDKESKEQLICPRCRTSYFYRTHCMACQVALVPVTSIIDSGTAFYCPECGKDADRDSFCRHCQSKVVRKR